MVIEIVKCDSSYYWNLEIDGRIISKGLSHSEAQLLAADWHGEKPWIASWRFFPRAR